jgi:hypothetical protein
MRAVINIFLRITYLLVGISLLIVGVHTWLPLALLGWLLFGGKENILWRIGVAPLVAGMSILERIGKLNAPDPFETEALSNLTNEDLLAVGSLCHHQLHIYRSDESLRKHFYKHLILCEAEYTRRNMNRGDFTKMPYEKAEQWVKERKHLKQFRF